MVSLSFFIFQIESLKFFGANSRGKIYINVKLHFSKQEGWNVTKVIDASVLKVRIDSD